MLAQLVAARRAIGLRHAHTPFLSGPPERGLPRAIALRTDFGTCAFLRRALIILAIFIAPQEEAMPGFYVSPLSSRHRRWPTGRALATRLTSSRLRRCFSRTIAFLGRRFGHSSPTHDNARSLEYRRQYRDFRRRHRALRQKVIGMLYFSLPRPWSLPLHKVTPTTTRNRHRE